MQPYELLRQLPQFNNNALLIKKHQNVDDIITAIGVAHKQYAKHYDKIGREFLGHSKKQTAFNIWKFLKKNIPYKAEPDNMQTIKSPAAIIHTGLNGTYYNDCKNYSLFAGGVLAALNRQGIKIPYVYRFASYNVFDKEPGHVFIVINPGGNEIWLDAVLSKFNYKKPYQYAKDKSFDMMYSISGVDDVITGRRAKRKAARQQRRTKRKERRAKRRREGRTFGKRIVKTIKKVGRAVLKVAAAPVRNAFLLLVKVNFRGLATRLKAAEQRGAGQLRSFWEGAGGKYQALLNNINQGSKKRRILGIGAAPLVAPATVSVAAPLLVKAASLLKKLGISGEDVGRFAGDIIKNRVQKAIENAETQSETQDQGIENTADAVTDAANEPGQEVAPEPVQTTNAAFRRRLNNQNAVKLVNENGQELRTTDDKPGINKNILIIGGLGVAALILMNKRK